MRDPRSTRRSGDLARGNGAIIVDAYRGGAVDQPLARNQFERLLDGMYGHLGVSSGADRCRPQAKVNRTAS
jgi:hypothetical protein